MSSRQQWLAEPLDPDVRDAVDRLERAPDVVRVAVMPDVHLSKEVCIGTVVATTRSIYPGAVGSDAGCGVAAVPTDVDAALLDDPRRAARVLGGFAETVPIVKRPHAVDLPGDLCDRPLSDPALEREKRRTARVQLGTVGRGNHFLELQSDDDGRLWVMVHTGSRGMGTAIRLHHEARSERVKGGLRRLDADSAGGRAYLADHLWALDYAEANRAAILASVFDVLAAELGAAAVASERVSCHHNFVRRETHDGRDLLVHRKGAISSRLGEPGIVPGSMGTSSYIVEGRGDPRSMCSSSHGAGRRMSRAEARRRIPVRDLDRQLDGVLYDRRKRSRLIDEAPEAYKDIDAVLRAQKELLVIRRRLRPVLVHKGT